jgi:hypothetical protein
MNAIEISSAVDEILSKAGIVYSARLLGETMRATNWKCDEWRVKFGKWETSYYTGTGRRKALTRFQDVRPQAPKAADVLHSLVLDSEADGMSFRDWCDNYGYSDDSLNALETYRHCCDTAQKLRATFKPDVLAAIRDAVQDL